MMIWKIMRGFLAALGFMVLVLAVMGAIGLAHSTPKLPQQFVLDITLNGTPADKAAPASLIEGLFDVEPRLADVTDMIAQAAQDRRVRAMIVRMAGGTYDWAAVQELRAAIATFRAAGKSAYVYSDSYGDLYAGMAEYYLASAFDEVWVQPVGSVSITGFYAEAPYVKGLLERIGVKAQMFQSGAYKTGPESLLRTDMSPEQREILQSILSSKMTDFFEAVSEARGLAPSQIGMLIDGAPYTAEEALARKLVDRVGYADELNRHVKGAYGQAEGLVDLPSYMASKSPVLLHKNARKATVALVHVNGMIVPGDQYGGMFAEPMAAADLIARQINMAAQDEGVSAIVLRVVSPGGSPTASETIRRAVEMARAAGKYVVVSMGSVAASGGYWVSVDADKIFALDGTLTGSIGVFGGKMDLSGLWDKVDVNWEGVKLGNNASMWSPNLPFSADGAVAVERMIEVTDNQFIERVSKGRGFAPEVVKKLAGGRVWTGRQAKTHGLVDDIGGYHAVLDHVAKHLGVDGRANLEVWTVQDWQDPFKAMGGMFRGVKAFVAPYVGAWVRMQNPAYNAAYVNVGY